MEDICQMHVSRVSGNGKESALAGSNTIVQRRRKGNWLVPLRSGSLHQIFKSSYCLPNQCLFLHINLLTLILFLDFIQEIFGFVSGEYWRSAELWQSIKALPLWFPTCSCRGVFSEEKHRSVQTWTPKSQECEFRCKWLSNREKTNYKIWCGFDKYKKKKKFLCSSW